MGTSFIGLCECGYESQTIYQGIGMAGGEPNLDIPFVCADCGTIVAGDYQMKVPPKCTGCGSGDTVQTVRMEPRQDGYLYPVVLPGPFHCPKCRQNTMVIGKGLWD